MRHVVFLRLKSRSNVEGIHYFVSQKIEPKHYKAKYTLWMFPVISVKMLEALEQPAKAQVLPFALRDY